MSLLQYASVFSILVLDNISTSNLHVLLDSYSKRSLFSQTRLLIDMLWCLLFKCPLFHSTSRLCSNIYKKLFSTGKDRWHYPKINRNKLFNRILTPPTHLHLTCSVTSWYCSLLSPDITDLLIQKYHPLCIFSFSSKKHFLKCIHSIIFKFIALFYSAWEMTTQQSVLR